jgi:hypothetical protein
MLQVLKYKIQHYKYLKKVRVQFTRTFQLFAH